MVAESFQMGSTKKENPHVGYRLSGNLDLYPRRFQIRLMMGGKSSTGPKHLSSLRRKRELTRPLWEEIKTLVSGLESDIEIPFICLENYWLLHKVFNGVVSTTCQRWNEFWTVLCFLRHETRIPAISQSSWDSFFLKYLSYHRAQNLQIKSAKLNMTSVGYSAQYRLMFQLRLFSYCNLLKARVVDVLL